ncbi:MAG TPA: sulfotransferase [Thermoanaerobaculia bacterium]|nr:sulfotransferase [Thermoanaerobaculia bacterium]
MLPRVESAPSSSPDRSALLREASSYARATVREARSAGPIRPGRAELELALEWLDHPVFVCGHHRTGTTLLHNLLDGHPELVVLPNEATYLTSFRDVASPSPTPGAVDRFVGEWIVRFIEPNYGPHFRLGRTGPAENPSVRFARRLLGWHGEVAWARPARASFALLMSLVAAFHDVACVRDRPRAWVEKTPLNELYVRRLRAAFPDARFIQLVRDPRATLTSLLELRETSGSRSHVASDARRIGRSLRMARRHQRWLHDRYLVVRYEDLAAETAHETERVRVFLGVAPSPVLSTPTVLGRAVEANSSFGPREVGVTGRSRQTRRLTPREEVVIDSFSATPARAFGYAVKAPSVLVSAALRLREHVRRASAYAQAKLGRPR